MFSNRYGDKVLFGFKSVFLHSKAKLISFECCILKLWRWLIPIGRVISSNFILLLYFLMHFPINCRLSFDTLHRNYWPHPPFCTMITNRSVWWTFVITWASVMVWNSQFNFWFFVIEPSFCHWWQFSAFDWRRWTGWLLLWSAHPCYFLLRSSEQSIASKLTKSWTILSILLDKLHIFIYFELIFISLCGTRNQVFAANLILTNTLIVGILVHFVFVYLSWICLRWSLKW